MDITGRVVSVVSNNGLQRTALRAAAEAERYAPWGRTFC
jgi:hypothetical protein